METNVFSLSQLLWQVINLAVLIAVFTFLGWRSVRMIRRRLQNRKERTE